MKKALAIVLTLVMAFSMSAMAFAAVETDTDATTAAPATTAAAKVENVKCGYCGSTFQTDAALEAHEATCAKAGNKNVCEYCGATFSDEALYNAHVDACEEDHDLVNLTIKDIIDAIIAILESENGQWNDIESIITKLIDLAKAGIDALSAAEVKGLVEDLEGILGGDNSLLNALKQKIKDLYAGEIATEPTEAETAPDTGSSVAGIAAFAAVSVAAAAFVCTKKRA